MANLTKLKIYANNNIVRLDNEVVKIEDYSNNLLDGFKDSIELIISNKDSYIHFIDKEFNKFRQVLRSTQVYSKFLIAASHPDYLENEEKHSALMKRIITVSKNNLEYYRIINEFETLLQWDVPYYYCYYDSKDLWSNYKWI